VCVCVCVCVPIGVSVGEGTHKTSGERKTGGSKRRFDKS